MQQKKKQGLISRNFKLRSPKSVIAIIVISITVYISWLFAFPLFGPVLSNYLNSLHALSIEKGKWIMLFISSMIASNLISGIIISKTKKSFTYILISAILICVTTIIFWLNYIDIYVLSVLFGLIAGISPVAWGTYFTENVTPEERGRIAGIAIGLALPIAQLFLITNVLEILASVENQILVIGFWMLATFLVLVFRTKNDKKEDEHKKTQKSRPSKQIIFYAIPMFLFHLVSGILMSMVFPTILNNVNPSIFYIIWAIPFVLGAIIAGVQLDIRGRKFPTIVGLAITGVSLAIIGILNITQGYLFLIPLGIGYSFVFVSSYIIWADLAPENNKATFYGLGFALINTAQLLGLILAGTHFGSVSTSQISLYMLFASVALFICIPPLILAEEVLPRSLIEKRQLMEYLDGVKDKFVRKK